MCGPTRDEEMRRWRELHDEELHDLLFLPNIIRMLKSRQVRYEGRISHVGGRGT
jgi:hypothetical protein